MSISIPPSLGTVRTLLQLGRVRELPIVAELGEECRLRHVQVLAPLAAVAKRTWQEPHRHYKINKNKRTTDLSVAERLRSFVAANFEGCVGS